MKYYHDGEQTSLFLTGMVGMMKALNVEVYQQAYADALKMKYFNQYDEKYRDIVELAEKTAKEFLEV